MRCVHGGSIEGRSPQASSRSVPDDANVIPEFGIGTLSGAKSVRPVVQKVMIDVNGVKDRITAVIISNVMVL